jgi:bacteriocin biosynthesis cyclodehydratase domain-containing protein
MTPMHTERREAHVQDHPDRGADDADRIRRQGRLSNGPSILTAPRYGQDRERPRLKPTIEILTDRDRVVLMRAGHHDGDVALEGDPAVLVELLRQLDGTSGRAEILAALRAGSAPLLSAADLDEAVDAMSAIGLVEDAAQDDAHLDAHSLDRYDRQLRYFGDLAAPGQARAAAQRQLEDATVVVLGLGGLGGLAASMLTACGIGTIVGVDDDRVEVSNLARQILYDQDDLGRLKVDAARDRLGRLNEHTRFTGIPRRMTSPEEIAGVVEGADFVVGAIDWPAAQIANWISRACFATGVPFITMGVFPPIVRIGPTYLPGTTGCLECQDAAYRRKYPNFDRGLAAMPANSPAATFAPACGVIGSLVANEVIAHITGLQPLTCQGRAFMLKLTTLEVSHEDVPQEPGCPVCGGGATAAAA